MSAAFLLCLGAILLLAGIGMPIAYAIITGSLVYLAAAGQDIGLAGKVLMDGLYSQLRPARRAAVHRRGQHHERRHDLGPAAGLLRRAVGRFRGGLGHVNVVASLIFSGMSGSAVADAAGSARSSSR
jgi:hypothetical protein